MSIDRRQTLMDMFGAAVGAASPAVCLPPNLPARPAGKVIVVGAGKAAAAMAAAVEASMPPPLDGLVVTRYGHGVRCSHIEVVEAGHPVPDAAGVAAAARILAKVKNLSADDLVLALISGGGSSLLAMPAAGISLEDKQDLNRALLKSGARIDEMNCVRKHLSAIKGGRLVGAAAPARVVSLIISDVPGDDLSGIASGPTVPDLTTRAQAAAILKKYKIDVPASVLARLGDPDSETPKPGESCFANARSLLIATPQVSLEAAAAVAQAAGFAPVILGTAIEGEARDVALVHAGIVKQIQAFGQPAKLPCAVISGGETTVTIRGNGRGGRNAEFLLSLAMGLDSSPGVCAIACDTDGIDGSEDNAGAIIDAETLRRAVDLNMDAVEYLQRNDAYTYFQRLGDLVVTGPTLTNVNDFRAVLIE